MANNLGGRDMKRMANAIVSFVAVLLEKLGLRCSECGSWDSCVVEHYHLECGTNVGGVLLMDPVYIAVSKRICLGCRHCMSEEGNGYIPFELVEGLIPGEITGNSNLNSAAESDDGEYVMVDGKATTKDELRVSDPRLFNEIFEEMFGPPDEVFKRHMDFKCKT